MMKYEYWLACLKGISSGKKTLLRERAGTAEALYYIEETQMEGFEFLNETERNTIVQTRKQWDVEREYDAAAKKGIRFVPWFSEDYPRCLKGIPDYPYALYVRGSLPGTQTRRAAVIGGGGKTYAVLGCGVDVCYPKEHIGLYTDILEQGGGILSEQPPGTPPLAQHFPARNRIISGLSDAVLVMEAGRKSGSLITVDMALEQGRDVYALPGPVNSSMSDGCNRLIRQGAGILLSPEDLAEEWGLDGNALRPAGTAPGKKAGKNEKELETEEKLVYSCLGLYPKGVDQVAAETKLDIKSVMELLVTLELEGYIREISKNQYIIARY